MTEDETGRAEVPGRAGADRGVRTLEAAALLRGGVGSEAPAETPSFRHPHLSHDPHVSTASDWQG